MITPKELFEFLCKNHINFFSGVPDSLLKYFCAYLSDHCSSNQHIISANEGNAVGLAAGHYLGSKKPSMVYLQNSGIGNIVNPILSLADKEVYKIPMLLLIGWRGEPFIKDEPQHIKQGKVTTQILDSIGVEWFILGPETKNPIDVFAKACKVMQSSESPVAVIVKKNTFEKYELLKKEEKEFLLLREEALKIVLDNLLENSLIVSTTGMTSREIFEYRESKGQPHFKDFLTVGSMGHTSSIAFGLSLSQPNKKIICIDGDGSMLMHLGATAIQGVSDRDNFFHILINNGSHDSVGGQPTVGKKINFCNIANACGYKIIRKVTKPEEIKLSINKLINSGKGPLFLEILVRKGFRSNLGRPTIKPLDNKKSFMDKL